MPRKPAHAPLNVFINARLVGQLAKASDGAVSFAYDPSWLARLNTFAISLSLPLRSARYTGDRVSSVFENLLPDYTPIRTRVAERVGAEGTDAYSMLAVIGRDCVGAMQFLSADETPGSPLIINGDPVDDVQIEAILKNLASAPLGLGADEDFRISIAGAQEKTALLWHKGQWHKPIGTTPTTHIFKPQIGKLPGGIDMSRSVENEYFCLKLLSAFGLSVNKAEMAIFGETQALVIERFDRSHSENIRVFRLPDAIARLPQEDLCQALGVPPTLKYENQGGPGIIPILDLLKGSDDPQGDQVAFLKSQIIFWLIGATDGHAKNVSLALTPGGRFRLTPFYDVLTIEPAHATGQIKKNQMKLAMAVGKNRHYRLDEIHGRHFVETARAANMPDTLIRRAIEEVAEGFASAFANVTEAMPADFPGEIVEATHNAANARLGGLETAKGEWRT